MAVRNEIPFAYLVQHDQCVNTSLLRHSNSIVLQAQWKRKCEDCSSDACIFVPGSSVNEGRNALWAALLQHYPGTVFTYVTLLDGEHSLSYRPEHMHTKHAFIERLDAEPHARKPYFVWEQMLLEYQPAIATPSFNIWGNVQSGLEVQFVSNFDHIMVAIHFSVASMFLPTETVFDDVCWWFGQFMYNVVASYFFPQQWIQINPLYCENKEHRSNEQTGESASAAPSKVYNRISSFEKPLMWMLASFKLSDIKHWIERFNFNTGNYLPLRQVSPDFPVIKSGIFATSVISKVDCCHRYWQSHGLVLREHGNQVSYLNCMVDKKVKGYSNLVDCPMYSHDLDAIMSSLLHVVQQQHHQIAEMSQQLAVLRANASCTSGQCSV